MSHPSRNSLETFKRETGLREVPLQGGDGSGQPGNRWLLLPGTLCQVGNGDGDGDAAGRTTGQRAGA